MNSWFVKIESVFQNTTVVSREDHSLDQFAVILVMNIAAFAECFGDSQNLVEQVQGGVESFSIEISLFLLSTFFDEFLEDQMVHLGL